MKMRSRVGVVTHIPTAAPPREYAPYTKAGKPLPTSGIEIVTPALAMEWLTMPGKPTNRHLGPAHLAGLRADMELGHWSLTHQGIAFDWNGHLRDGHHRLEALIEADMTIAMFVTRGLDPESIVDADRMKVRRVNDVLTMFHATGYTKVRVAVANSLRILECLTGGAALTPHSYRETVMRHATGISLCERAVTIHPTLVVRDTGQRIAITAPHIASFIYAWPCYPKVIGELVEEIVGTGERSENAQACVRLIISHRSRGLPRELQLKLLRLFAAHVAGESTSGLDRVIASEIGYDFFRVSRARLGLPHDALSDRPATVHSSVRALFRLAEGR